MQLQHPGQASGPQKHADGRLGKTGRNRRRTLSLVLRAGGGAVPVVLLLFAGCGKKPPSAAGPPDPAPAFWVWHRASALTADEESAVKRSGAGRLYRQIGEFGWGDGKWSARPVVDAVVLLDRPGTIPVIRLDPGPSLLERPDAAASLAKWLRHFFNNSAPSSLQLDHDCPVRLLPRYAGFLRELRMELGLKEISVTALASWIGTPGFAKLGEAADELVPMFYDLTADPPQDIAAGKARPMTGPEAAEWIARWKSCHSPWRAGLANFERLTLFNGDGSLVGHLRQWTPESLAGSPFLEPLPSFSGGVAFRVTRPATLHGTRLESGQLLVWRAPDDAVLRGLITDAFAAGARSIVWFALPGPGLRARHTPPHLAALARGESPAPGLHATLDASGRVILRNDGPGDLVMRPGEPMHRLVLASDQPATFTATGPGAYFRIDAATPAEFSRKITLTFVRLHVGEEIASESGLIPARGERELQWSVDDNPPAPLP